MIDKILLVDIFGAKDMTIGLLDSEMTDAVEAFAKLFYDAGYELTLLVDYIEDDNGQRIQVIATNRIIILPDRRKAWLDAFDLFYRTTDATFKTFKLSRYLHLN